LVLVPVDHLPKTVSVLLRIKDIVGIAAKLTRGDAVQFAVPFPGHG
jgi:hypothetical protein